MRSERIEGERMEAAEKWTTVGRTLAWLGEMQRRPEEDEVWSEEVELEVCLLSSLRSEGKGW